MGDSFGQLAAVSAFLGGFVVTFLGALTNSRDKRRRVGAALFVSAFAAVCLLLAALGWALLAAKSGELATAQGAYRALVVEQLRAGLQLNSLISLLFVCGVGLLAVLLGLSGWLRSRHVGLGTTLLAIAMALTAVILIRPFVGEVPQEAPNNSSKPTPLRGSVEASCRASSPGSRLLRCGAA